MSLCADFGIPHSQLLSWEPEDRAKAVAFAVEKNQRCQMCGTAPWEWEANRFAYEPVVTVCRGCQIKDGVSSSMERADGATVELLPTVGPEAARRHVAAARHWGAQP